MLKHGARRGDMHLAKMKAHSLVTLTPPRLRKIKQVELYKKWRQYVDPRFWEEMCPKPSYDVFEHVKNDKVSKRNGTLAYQSVMLQEKARKKAEKEAPQHTKVAEAATKKGVKLQRDG
jgi:hypothetical protein